MLSQLGTKYLLSPFSGTNSKIPYKPYKNVKSVQLLFAKPIFLQ